MKSVERRRWDLPTAMLLLLALYISAQRAIATDWTPGLWVTSVLTLLGGTLGLALSASRFQRKGITLLSFGYSVIMVPWVLGKSQYPGYPWQDCLANLSGRLMHSIKLFISNQPVEDTLLFITMAALLYWILGLHAGYALARKNSYVSSVVPAGVVMLLVQVYDTWGGDRLVFLALYVFVCLLLLGRMYFSEKEQFWGKKHVLLLADVRIDLAIGLAITTLVIILLAWLVPSPAKLIVGARDLWNDITSPWRDAGEDLGNVVAGLDHESDMPTADIYGSSMPLGRNSATGDAELFIVRLPEMDEEKPYYWTVRIYDQYNEGRWYITYAREKALQPNQGRLNIVNKGTWPIEEFTFSVPENFLFTLATPARPVWINRPAILTYQPIPGDLVDPLLISVDTPIQPGETYSVSAILANPGLLQLQAAGSDYPAWVTDRYLQLPEDFPEEIVVLARELTEGIDSPYDKATAITNYLRTQISYETTVAPPPEGMEPLAWFLFNTREGFCNYYASAEVVMLRSIGIPARLAVGFSNGERMDDNRRLVRQHHAHAWPEVYFPGIGWVEFEPTVSEQVIVRPLSTEGTAREDGTDYIPGQREETDSGGDGLRLPMDVAIPEASGTTEKSQPSWVYMLFLLASLAGTIALLILMASRMRRYQGTATMRSSTPVLLSTTLERLSLPVPAWLQRWVRWNQLGTVEQSFHTIPRSLRWLGTRPNPSRSPAASAALLQNLLPEAGLQIQILLDEYQRTIYGPQAGSAINARAAAKTVQRILRRTWLNAIINGRPHILAAPDRRQKNRRMPKVTRGKIGKDD